MSSVAQMLRQAEVLKASVSDSSKTISETWVTRQKLEDIYKKILLLDLEYALDKKVEQELWNHAFKNQITNLQTQAKDKQNVKRAEIQATLYLFLETASGFYLQFLQLICTTFKLDLPFRRKSAYFGIMKERTQMKLKVTPPKKSSCLYVCQHCLVHLGDIARYRQQIDQAQTYYWHAAYLVPFNGQPYNQLAILEAAKGNKLSTVFYYIRSLAVKVPFPVAATNLEKLYAKLAKETPDFKGKLSASEMITGFLQFHALVHLCSDLDKAEELLIKLAQGLPAHVTSQSFPWQVLVQIVAINIFALNHIQQTHGLDSDIAITNGDCELTEDEERCYDLVFSLTVSMLDILLQYTPKQEHKVRDYFTLPAIKLLLDWLKLTPTNFDKPVLKHSPLWENLCKVLNSVQSQQSIDREEDISKYEDLPLPEDAELRCFQPIEKAQSGYSYSKVPADGIPSDVEAQLRCQRLLELGEWIIAEVPSINMSMLGGKSGKHQFKSPTPPPNSSGKTATIASVTKARPSVSLSTPSPKTISPEKKSNRQNVAIQAIIQKQAQNSQEKTTKDDPASPKYLLGVPTSEPVFFKSGGARQPAQQPTSNSPQGPQTGAKSTGQPAGVLVLKSQDLLNQTTKPPNKSPGWQQQQQRPGSSWQQSKQPDKMTWSNTQISPQQGQQKMVRGQLSPWQQQQQQNVGVRPQLSPQTSQGQWQFPSQPSGGRGDYRPRSPTAPMPIRDGQSLHHNMTNAPMQSPQNPLFHQGQKRPGFSPGQPTPVGPSPNKDSVASDQNFKGLMFNKMSPGPMGPSNAGLQNERFGMPGLSSMGSGDGSHMPFSPGQMPMFRHPPPARFPPPPNFLAPPPDLGSNQTNMQTGIHSPQITSPVTGPHPFSDGFMGNQSNFSHAPGTERQPHPGPGNQSHQQQQIPMHYSQGQFVNPFPGFMGFSGLTNNQLKSPLDGLFGKQRFAQDEIPPNMADIIGTLSKMAIQPPKENMIPARSSTTFQGHAEGTPKPESFYPPQRSSSVPTVNIDLETKSADSVPATTTPQTQPQQGTYSLFSGSPWLSSGDSKSLGSSPFSSQSSSMRNSPDPGSDTFSSDGKSGQVLDMGLRYSSPDDRKPATGEQQSSGPFFQNNMQSLWSSQAQSPLERLLELQKQQRQTEPH